MRELSFGEGVNIYNSALVLGYVVVRRNYWIGPFTVLDGSGGLCIGEYCSISAGVQIYNHDTVRWAVNVGVQSRADASQTGDRCYVGSNVVISKGVSIGYGCVIGANSFESKDFPSGAIAWGVLARCHGEFNNTENG